MKIGISAPIALFDEVLASGADFIEINVQTLCGLDEQAFAAFQEKALKHKGFVFSANCLFPFSGLRLTGEVDENAVRTYCDKVFPMLASVGVQMVVFGSGGAKRVPEGFSHEKATEQLKWLSALLGEYAEKYGQTVVIEPLRRQECNIILTVQEACALAKSAHSPHVKGLVDFYHFSQNGESIESGLVPYVAELAHVHIANPETRTAPTADDGKDYQSFVNTLRQGGYAGAICYEGKLGEEIGDLKDLVAFLKSL